MDDWAQGYRIDAALHPWGTRFEEPAERPCATAYGFDTIYAELSAAGGAGRPVTSVAYELANAMPGKAVFAVLVKRLGPPTDIDRSDEETGAGSPDTVVLYAEWQRDNHQIAISLYGAPRASKFGDGIGKLYLSWSDLVTAAGPFVESWRTASDAVARAAVGSEGDPAAIFSVAWPVFDPTDAPEEPHICALATPELLETPPLVAERLGSSAFALWQGGGNWHLSHGRATVVLGATPVQILEIEPARGGGYAAIEVGAWSVRDEYGSRSIADATALLECVPGLTIERHRGHDA